MKYKAYLIEENDGSYNGSIKELEMTDVHSGNVIIKVHYSSLNYKDALAATGVKGVASSYPFVPGIDVAGEILKSSSENFKIGDKVIATGYKLGMSVYGGFGQLVQVPEKWVIPLPNNLTLLNSMSLGTAGLTAGACVKKILDAGPSLNNPILVSGATGGVGSVAVNLLSKLDFEVHAITGKPNETEILKKMGASEIIDRHKFMADPVKPLDKAIYSAGVDTVGGEILSKMLTMISSHGSVACCGNVGGMKFTSSVFPFILRGVKLWGIDSVAVSAKRREFVWSKVSSLIDFNILNETVKIISMEELLDIFPNMLKGQTSGRIVVDVNK